MNRDGSTRNSNAVENVGIGQQHREFPRPATTTNQRTHIEVNVSPSGRGTVWTHIVIEMVLGCLLQMGVPKLVSDNLAHWQTLVPLAS